MKFKFFVPVCGVAVAIVFSSCSQHKAAGGYDVETAEQIANGTMPPWIADGSAGNETGAYQSTGSSSINTGSYAYNPPSKPAVKKTSSKATKSAKSSKKASKVSKSGKITKKKRVVSKSYSVRKGDTLGKIAKKQGVSVKALKQANGLRSDMIHINQTLKVPKK